MPSISSNIWRPSQTLLNACQEHGFALLGQRHPAAVATSLTLLEDGSPASSIVQDSTGATVLMESIRMGAGLLFTFGTYPSGTVYRLSEALPSTGWTSQLRPTPFDPQSPTPILIKDTTFFSGADLDGLAVPLGVDLRPVSAVERGQSRYERYRLQHPFTRADVLPHSDLWSRPLLNREWTLRACYDELACRPLLVTGRYGAGRVAMLATTSAAVGESAAAQAFWKAVIAWLAIPPSSVAAPDGKPTLAMSFSSTGSVRLTMTGASGPAQLVMRVLNRDGAMLADGAGESTKQLTLLHNGPTVVDLPLPTPSVRGLEPDLAETSFQVRAGLLSTDGSVLLAEQRALSPEPALRLDIAIENLYLAGTTFPGPGADVLQGFRARMGLAVSAYAYPPGASLLATATLRLQCENLAPMAAVQDLNQPDNASVVALNDRGAAARQGPGDKILGYGTWTGQRGAANALQFTWSEPVHIRSVTLVGNIGVGFALHNPGQATLELNGQTVAHAGGLDSAFASGLGQVRIDLPLGSAGTNLTVRLPWVAQKGTQPRQEPWLGDVVVEGRRNSEAAASREDGTLTVELVGALNGERRQVKTHSMSIAAGEAHSIEISTSLPQTGGVGVYLLEASFRPAGGNSIHASAPILVISPRKTLRSLTEIVGPGSFGVALNVTNGFTKFSMAGTGTSEPWNGWSHPDDLVWAYSRQFKEIPHNARAAANRLYASPSDMRHYSIPWREFSNGDLFFPTAVGGLVRYLKAQHGWSTTRTVLLTFADRWVTGPDLSNCNSWQEYIAFDSHLRSTGGQGLEGRTHSEVEASLHANFENEWQVWHLGRYVEAVRSIREAFQVEGKDVTIYSQGIPGVAGSPGRELAGTIRGMNDDFTWGMQDNSPNLTTGRTMGCVAVNPVWQMSTLLPWGFASPVFNNWQWHAPVSTLEPLRRLLYNRTWRGIVWDGGAFGALATYGYGNNVGFPYATTREEYQQWWYVQQRGSLLQPESPLGAGLIISTQKNADPRSIRWNGNNPAALPETGLLMDAFRSLSEAGVSLPFATNASTLAKWEPTPGASLIVLNLEDFSAEEMSALGRLAGRVPIAVLCRSSSLSGAAAAVASQPGVLTIDTSPTGLTHPQAVRVAGQLLDALKVPIRFSGGLSGYGFRCQDLSLVVVEDWLEQARIATVQVSKAGNSHQATAANLNDHSSLKVKDAGSFWEIAVPIRSGDGALIAVWEA